MRKIIGTLLAVATLVAAAPGAQAAPIITDQAHDAWWPGVAAEPSRSNPRIDIVAGDVVYDGASASLEFSFDLLDLDGAEPVWPAVRVFFWNEYFRPSPRYLYEFRFVAQGVEFRAVAWDYDFDDYWEFDLLGAYGELPFCALGCLDQIAYAAGTVDPGSNRITVEVPLSAVNDFLTEARGKPPIGSGSVLRDLLIGTSVNHGDTPEPEDQAGGSVTYTLP